MEENVLTTTDTAKLLGISVRTVQLLIEGGGLPSWKTPGGHRRVRRADVEALLARSMNVAKRGSAAALVLTDERRKPLFERAFGDALHLSPSYETDAWSAALAVGNRAPAVVIVDLDTGSDQGLNLLASLATDERLKHIEYVAASNSKSARLAAGLPANVHFSTLETLPELLDRLTREPQLEVAQTALGWYPVAPNEQSRLEAVRRSGLVDTAAEPPFDRLTWLAARDLKSPVALITLLTPERQWFKSRVGLDMQEVPRQWAFCNHTVLQRDLLEVRDLAKNPSFSSNPAVAESPHFRFYAGAPIYDADGFALGSLCVLDYRSRQLDVGQRRVLIELAAIASDEVRLREALSKS